VTLECLHTVCQSDASPSCRGEEGIRCPLRLSPPAACAPGAPPPLNTLRPSWRVEATPFLPHTKRHPRAHSLRGLKQWGEWPQLAPSPTPQPIAPTQPVANPTCRQVGVQVSAALPAGRRAPRPPLLASPLTTRKLQRTSVPTCRISSTYNAGCVDPHASLIGSNLFF
jgi:hypothetical protein